MSVIIDAPPTPEQALARGRQIIAAQPFASAMGLELEEMAPGRAVMRLPLRADHKQHHGFAHGGAIAFLCDCALTFVGGSVLGDCLTAEFKLNFIRPGRGVALIAEGALIHGGMAQAVTRCEIFAEEEDGTRKVVAAAQGTIRRIERP